MRSILALPTLFVCLFGAPAMGADDAAALLKTIQSTETPDVDRANAFEKIGDIADDNAVEPLVGFLGDKKWSHYARFALQKMEGQNVTEALLESLDKLQGDVKLGVICTIGRRQDPIAAAPLAELLADADEKVADSAAVALGWIGTPDAAAALTKAFRAEKDLHVAKCPSVPRCFWSDNDLPESRTLRKPLPFSISCARRNSRNRVELLPRNTQFSREAPRVST